MLILEKFILLMAWLWAELWGEGVSLAIYLAFCFFERLVRRCIVHYAGLFTYFPVVIDGWGQFIMGGHDEKSFIDVGIVGSAAEHGSV